MAAFNYTSTNVTSNYLKIEIEGNNGIIFCNLDGEPLTQIEIDAITDGMLESGYTQNQINNYIAEVELMKSIHNQIIQVANNGNMDDLIDSIGNNPSGWFYPFCIKYNINTNPTI